jgi:two-component system nitrogen regulation sensor histidine kinase NtrY
LLSPGSKGLAWPSVALMALFIVLFRFVNLHYHLPDFYGMLNVFDPKIFHSGMLYPSFGDLCINILYIFWFVAFIYLQRRRLFKAVLGKAAAYVTVIVAILLLIVLSTSLLRLFFDLVINSTINFNVNNVLSLSAFSIVGVLMLCFSFLIFYLVNEIILFYCLKLDVPLWHQLFLLVISVIVATIVFTICYEFTFFYLLWMALVLIRAYGFIYQGGKLTTTSFLGVIFICALISAIKLNHFESIKESEIRKSLIKKLKDPVDHDAENTFKRIEHSIVTDTAIIRYFEYNVQNTEYLVNRFQKLYFDGYLSKYAIRVHEYDANDQPLSNDDNYPVSVFKDQVVYNSYKIESASYFYRYTERFGFQSYFAILPIKNKTKQLGTLVVEFSSKPLQTLGIFPDLLIDGPIRSEDQFKDYSYAYYFDNKLQSQRGNYVYTLKNSDFKGKLKDFVVTNTKIATPEWHNLFATYQHLIYKPSNRYLIVVSKEINPLYDGVTAITFFFMSLLIFSAIIIVGRAHGCGSGF